MMSTKASLVERAAVEPALDGRVGRAKAEVGALRRAERIDDIAVVVPDDRHSTVGRVARISGRSTRGAEARAARSL